MIVTDIIFFVAAMFFLIKSAELSTRFASRVARAFHMSEFVLSFFIVAVISAMPETAVAINSAIKGIPQFGISALLGSNVADLTLVFGVVAMFSTSGIAVRSQLLRKDFLYVFLLLFPLLLGSDGQFTRYDGALLLLSGMFFFFTLSIETKMFRKEAPVPHEHSTIKNAIYLVLGILVLLVSASYTVKYGVYLAKDLGMPETLIGLIFVSLGTCLPELLFSIQSIRHNHDALALGDILGTVIIDATIVVGIVSLIKPFAISPLLVGTAGGAMFIAGITTIFFIRSDKVISKKEGLILMMLYLFFVFLQFILAR